MEHTCNPSSRKPKQEDQFEASLWDLVLQKQQNILPQAHLETHWGELSWSSWNSATAKKETVYMD